MAGASAAGKGIGGTCAAGRRCRVPKPWHEEAAGGAGGPGKRGGSREAPGEASMGAGVLLPQATHLVEGHHRALAAGQCCHRAPQPCHQGIMSGYPLLTSLLPCCSCCCRRCRRASAALSSTLAGVCCCRRRNVGRRLLLELCQPGGWHMQHQALKRRRRHQPPHLLAQLWWEWQVVVHTGPSWRRLCC